MFRNHFTAEQKKAAIAEFDSNGGNIGLAINALGYPRSYNTLKAWVLERDAAQGVASVTTVRAVYPDSVRVRALELYKAGVPNHEIVGQLGLNDISVVYYWLKTENNVSMPRRLRMPAKPDDADAPQIPDTEEGKLARIRELELENDILREVVDTLKAVSLDSLTNREKTLIIDALRQKGNHRLNELTAFLKISKSSYEYQHAAIARGDKYADLREEVRKVFEVEKASRGYRFVHQKLRQKNEPVVVSEKVVRRIMAEDGLYVVYNKKRRHYSSYEGEISSASDNLVKRDFHAEKPNLLWLTDITEFKLPIPGSPKVYLSPILDCFDGKLVSWEVGIHPDAKLANASLDGAIATLKDGSRPVCHSDRGGHYRWTGWIERCEKAGITRSMSKKGCSPDNSAMEGFFGRLKNEFFYYRDWHDVTIEQFITQLNTYLRYYNEERIKQSLGWKSPVEYRKSLGLAA